MKKTKSGIDVNILASVELEKRYLIRPEKLVTPTVCESEGVCQKGIAELITK